jgi:amyloid beta A4 precursor protein-binding family B protein 1-interacting protein
MNTSTVCASSPKKLDEPPQDFLTDLQRVMQKKWQVAQKCNIDKETSPQEILGFRFEPTSNNGGAPMSPSSEECQSENGDVNPVTLNNVRAWVSQHYGNNVDEIPPVHGGKPIPPIPNAKPAQRVSFALPHPHLAPPPQNAPSPNFPPPPVPVPEQGLIYRKSSLPPQPPSHGVVIYENFQGRKTSLQMPHPANNNISHVQLRNKKPPPPIPKRADSTHLSAHLVYN